jgi:catechol 2,3-dioxygenase-like lactoylglutathione lyase family enzyme
MAKKKAKKEKKKAKKAAKKAKKAEKQAMKASKAAAMKASKAAAKKAKKATKKPSKPASMVVKAVERRHVVRTLPESLRLRSAGPSFTVNDIHKSLAFYRDVLGFTPRERWEEGGELQGIELAAGSVIFWLGQDDWKKGRDRVKGQGFRMYCSTAQDIDAFADRVRKSGGTIVDGPRDEPWGGRAFAVRDLDGFVITFASGG